MNTTTKILHNSFTRYLKIHLIHERKSFFMAHTFKKNLSVFSILIALSLAACSTGSNNSGPGAPYSLVSSSDNLEQSDVPLEDRFNELEERVTTLEDDLKRIKPSVNTLMAIESDIQDLVGELSSLTDIDQAPLSPPSIPSTQEINHDDNIKPDLTTIPNTSSDTPLALNAPQNLTANANDQKVSSPPASVPNNQTNTTAKKEQVAKKSSSSSLVESVRIGKHSNTKTRLVIDFQKGSTIDHTIAETNDRLILTLNNTGWQALTQWTSKNIPLVKSYNAKIENGHSMLSLATDDNLTLKLFTLPENNQNGPRLVLDFEQDS
jgi:hypothetical protein